MKPVEPFKRLIKGKSPWLRLPKELGISYLPQSISFNTDITRSYYELQERDMEQLDNTSLPLSFASDFLWNRNFSLRWDPTKQIHFNFSSGTNAEIEQPYVPLNKDLYPTEYEAWKDSVRTSLLHFGAPLSYQQQTDISWNIPVNKIPVFDWITSDVKYAATYNWQRGTELPDGSSMGNTIANSRNASANGKLNFETLYNHSKWLKEVNRMFSGQKARGRTADKQKKPEFFEKEIQLLADTTVTIPHNQRTKSVRVTALRWDGQRYPLRFRVLDANRIEILSQDTAKVKVKVIPKRRREEMGWYKTLQYTARGLMLIRNVSVSYKNTQNMSVPGFLPNVGDMLGQHRTAGAFAPGLDFAFGVAGEDYIRKAYDREWLLCSDSIVSPATVNRSENLDIKATLEPVRELKVNLNLSRTVTKARTIQYMFEGMPVTQTGTFNMTTIAFGTAFKGIGSADNGYRSSTFEHFLSLLPVYRERFERRYQGTKYPQGTAHAGETFNPEYGSVTPYSSDVMIPAFLDAYTASGGGMDIFPALRKLLPNWSLSYAGLAKLPRMKKVFKSFNLNHSYKCTYAVGSYNTFTAFHASQGDYGFVDDVETGAPIPSSMFDVSTISVNENFSPLVGVDMTFLNNVTAKVEHRRSRVMALSMTSQQLTETHSRDFTIGAGYKINDFRLFGSGSTRKTKGKQKGGNDADDEVKSNISKKGNKGFSGNDFSHSLNLRLDISFRNQSAIQRNILTLTSQATSGNKVVQASFTADYAISKYLTLSLYYDRQVNRPLLTSSSYPTRTQDFGINLKFQLAR